MRSNSWFFDYSYNERKPAKFSSTCYIGCQVKAGRVKPVPLWTEARNVDKSQFLNNLCHGVYCSLYDCFLYLTGGETVCICMSNTFLAAVSDFWFLSGSYSSLLEKCSTTTKQYQYPWELNRYSAISIATNSPRRLLTIELQESSSYRNRVSPSGKACKQFLHHIYMSRDICGQKNLSLTLAEILSVLKRQHLKISCSMISGNNYLCWACPRCYSA